MNHYSIVQIKFDGLLEWNGFKTIQKVLDHLNDQKWTEESMNKKFMVFQITDYGIVPILSLRIQKNPKWVID